MTANSNEGTWLLRTSMPQFSSVLGQADFALGSVPLCCGSGFEVTDAYG